MMNAFRQFCQVSGKWTQGLAVVLAGFAAAQSDAQVGDLAKLKIYRNYYSIHLESPEAHQIEVWYKSPDQFGFMQWDWNNVAIQADQDLSKLTKEDFVSINVAIAGWPKPPQDPTPIPAELEPKRAELEAAFRRIFPDLQMSDFMLVYNGYRAKIDINEYVPVTKTEDGIWIGPDSSREYFVDLKNMSMERIGSSGSGYGLLFYGLETEEQVNQLKWLDFELPSSIVGSSILALDYDFERPNASQLHLDTHAALMDRVLKSAVSLQAGTPVDTRLDEILAKQGETLLPVGFKQYFEFSISGYGRVGENATTEQMDIETSFVVSLEDKNFAQTKLHEASGFEISISGNLLGETPTMQVVIKDASGNLKKLSATINTEEMRLVRSGDEVMAFVVPLAWESEGETSLPGSGEFTSFDFYLRSEMVPSRLTGISNK
jgi:hypothetical protein